MPYWQHVTKDEIRFGNTDLVLKSGLKDVKSYIVPPASQNNNKGDISGGRSGRLVGGTENDSGMGSHFSFGNDLI